MCFQGICSQNIRVLWLTPLFPVDYTRCIAREAAAHLSVDHSGGIGRPGSWTRKSKRPKSTRGRLGHNGPLESVRRVSLQERIDRWTGRGMAWLVRKLVAMLLRNATPVPTPHPDVSGSAIPLHRDPWCGTYVSPEISFPLEQAGQVVHFCSAECRTRYQQSSQRAASA
jgi:YHS domain-containing protein